MIEKAAVTATLFRMLPPALRPQRPTDVALYSAEARKAYRKIAVPYPRRVGVESVTLRSC